MLKTPKGRDIHISLAKKIANLTGNKYITYDWMIKAIAIILSGTTYNDLLSMVSLSAAVKRGMQAKGLVLVNQNCNTFPQKIKPSVSAKG